MCLTSGDRISEPRSARHPSGWQVRQLQASPEEFHSRQHPQRREVWVHDWPASDKTKLDERAGAGVRAGAGEQAGASEQARAGERASAGWLILGSSQDISRVDTDRLDERGIGLFRRRSGGGAVLLKPDAQVWIDVLIPRADSLWQDDLSMSGLWLGDLWRRVLEPAGLSAEVHQGPYVSGKWGTLACYLSQAAGEVFVDGRKCVGISQRRSKQGARFQLSLIRRCDPRELAGLFRLSAPERRELELALERGVLPLADATALGADELAGRFLEAITDI